MQKEFTKEFMIANKGCYSESELLDTSFMANIVTIDSILDSEIPLKDKYWFVCKKLATKEQNQQIAISVAEIVLPIYEARHPDNKDPRLAIEAAKLYLADKITIEELKSERYTAAYADAYAYAAVYAIADAAAYAAVYAGKQPKDYKELLLVFLKEFVSSCQ